MNADSFAEIQDLAARALSCSNLIPDITITRYSNLAYVQASPRDVCVDFLEMPGVKKDGKMVVNGTRVYMSHVAAQKLGEVLQSVLKKAIQNGGIERLKEAKRP
ncbi:MAG: hypothetical protein A3K60_02800 [Euryarchaeota archaeon RBG_19FT_COMBO_56_21]|nr:MAG: hypothetical protein A3K60_02800 [Euryarchaeota archaeon RBG_19FT_COMBO_56_21]